MIKDMYNSSDTSTITMETDRGRLIDDILEIPKETTKSYVKPVSYDTYVLRACRILFYIVLFVSVFVSGVYCTLILLSLIAKLTKSKAGEERRNIAIDIAVCGVFHPLVNFVLAVLRLMFHRFRKPKIKEIVTIVIVEVVAASGEFLLLFRVFVHMDSLSVSIVILYLILVPTTLQSIQASYGVLKNGCKMSWLTVRNTFELLPCVIQIACLICFIVFVVPKICPDNQDLQYMLPIAIVMKSVGFYDTFFRKGNGRHKKLLVSNFSQRDSSYTSNIPRHYDAKIDVHRIEVHNAEADRQADRKAMLLENVESRHMYLYKSCVKVWVFIIFMLLVHFNDGVPFIVDSKCEFDSLKTNITQTRQAVDSVCSMSGSGVYNCIHNLYEQHALAIQLIILSSVFSYVASLACRLNMQKLSFCLPLNLIPATVGLVIFCDCKFINIQQHLGISLICVARSSDEYGVLFALEASLWVSIFISTWHIWVPNIQRLPNINRLFVVPLIDGLFPVMNIHLRRRNDSDLKYAQEPEVKCTPMVKVCVTMWHETSREMLQLLKSLFKLDQRVHVRYTEENIDNSFNKDDLNIEVHVVFDNAFEWTEANGNVPNEYVCQFIECVNGAARYMLGEQEASKWTRKHCNAEKSTMPYGGRLTWTLPGGTKMIVHLKDKQHIRIKKRSSQVMYLYYSLLFGHDGLNENEIREKMKNTFVLTLDGDVDFEPESIWQLMYRMQMNPDVGAVSGRVHPIGSGPLVWYQQFEYSLINWLNKATEDVFGCVLCCSGCFSLYRGSALISDNVLKTYTKLPTKGRHLLVREQGEDRWLCFLVQKQGYKVEFCPGADAKTYAPEGLGDFFVQRKRWCISTVLHTVEFLQSRKNIIYNNANFSLGFFIYVTVMFGLDILSPALIINSINGRLMSVLNLNVWCSFMVLFAPVATFAAVCIVCKKSVQLIVAAICSGFYCILVILVTIYLVMDIGTSDVFKNNLIFLIFVVVVCIFAAIFHPKELTNIAKAPLFYVLMPSTYIFVTVYYVCNMNDASWGTRENKESPKNNTITDGSVHGKSEKWMCMPELDSFEDVEMTHETEFWNRIIERFLQPLKTDAKVQDKFKDELLELRNKWIFGFLLANSILILTLLQISANRYKFTGGALPSSIELDLLIVEGIFAIIILFQVSGMIYHRWNTFLHLIANTTIYKRKTKKGNDSVYSSYSENTTSDRTLSYDNSSSGVWKSVPSNFNFYKARRIVTSSSHPSLNWSTSSSAEFY